MQAGSIVHWVFVGHGHSHQHSQDLHIPLADLHIRLETVAEGLHSLLADRHTGPEIVDWALVQLIEVLVVVAFLHIEGNTLTGCPDTQEFGRSEGCILVVRRRIRPAQVLYPYPT